MLPMQGERGRGLLLFVQSDSTVSDSGQAAPYAARVLWVGVLAALAVVVAVGVLAWRDNRRGPVCPWCGKPETFGPEGTADVCTNCGFDFRRDDY